jgi:3-hydroxyisobutyrate dehydrogenase
VPFPSAWYDPDQDEVSEAPEQHDIKDQKKVEGGRMPVTVKDSVGLVGLGAMGRPAAEHLAAAGHETSCFDTDREAMDAVAAKGVRSADSLTMLGASSSLILILVPTDADVVKVCSASDGVLAEAKPGTVVLICSSVKPETCRTVADTAAPLGVKVLDAALTGGVRAAESGEINLLVGGDKDVLDRIRPSLEPWTKTVHYLGKLGSGQVGKTVNNLCHWGQLSAIVEALRLGRELGVEPTALRAAVLDGPAASRTLAEMQLMRLTWFVKDLANAFDMAETVDFPMPVAHTVREAMDQITVGDIAALYEPRSAPDTATAAAGTNGAE